jgi:hypothetical protein
MFNEKYDKGPKKFLTQSDMRIYILFSAYYLINTNVIAAIFMKICVIFTT